MEFSILDFIQNHLRTAFLDTIMPVITALASGGILWVLLTVLLLIFPKTRKVGVTMAVSLVVESLCCNVILKPLIHRTRPFDVQTTIELLITKPTDYSFPSGHTGVSFATATALYFGGNRLWIPAVVLSILIGFSRMYLYVHYPTDVLAGAVLGTLSGWCATKLVLYGENK